MIEEVLNWSANREALSRKAVLVLCGRTLLSAFDVDFDFCRFKSKSTSKAAEKCPPHTKLHLQSRRNSRHYAVKTGNSDHSRAITFGSVTVALDKPMDFGPTNPFYAPSTLPFHAPPFDKIKDSDYQPAIEAGMAEQRQEMRAIADNPAPPTFENTLVAMEKTGLLFNRAMAAFNGVTGANLNPELQKVQDYRGSQTGRAFGRDLSRLQIVPTGRRDLQATRFAEARCRIAAPGRVLLQEICALRSQPLRFRQGRTEKAKRRGVHPHQRFHHQVARGHQGCGFRHHGQRRARGLERCANHRRCPGRERSQVEGYVLPLQNTTQQPDLDSLRQRSTRQTLFENSWNRAERGGANDTRDIVSRLAQLRSQKAKLLGFPNYAAWKLEDQMAKTPDAALKFMDALVPGATARAADEAQDIQAVIDSQNGGGRSRLQTRAVGLELLLRAGSQSEVRHGRGRRSNHISS